MSKTVILDAGHGGCINGVYQTKGKRSPKWVNGVLYEGSYNRAIVNRIMEILDLRKIPYYNITPELKDISLTKRVVRVNAIYKNNPSVYLLSLHANAGGGTGFEGFTTRGKTRSDDLCEYFLKNIKKYFCDGGSIYNFKMRKDYTDNDLDKEVDFKILRETECPAMLLELLFMDNLHDYKFMHDTVFRNDIATKISDTIEYLYINPIN